MQMAQQAAAGPRSAPALPSHAVARRPARSSRGSSLVVRANQEAFCRDLVAEPKAPTATVEGTSTLVFVGAGGETIEVDAPKSKYILDSGIDANIELPFTCRGGICGACVVKVTEGECDQSDVMDLSFCMSEDEIAEGMTLICMARPVSDRVVMETQSDWGYALGITEWKGPSGHISGKRVEPNMGKAWDTSKWSSDSSDSQA